MRPLHSVVFECHMLPYQETRRAPLCFGLQSLVEHTEEWRQLYGSPGSTLRRLHGKVSPQFQRRAAGSWTSDETVNLWKILQDEKIDIRERKFLCLTKIRTSLKAK